MSTWLGLGLGLALGLGFGLRVGLGLGLGIWFGLGLGLIPPVAGMLGLVEAAGPELQPLLGGLTRGARLGRDGVS